jgi:hypothetical protein
MDWERAIEWNRQVLMRVLAMLVAMAGLVPDGEPGTLPRHLHRGVLRLLRPAEAATRRLVIAAARGIVVTLPPPRARKPKPQTMEPLLRSLGIAVMMSPADIAAAAEARRAAARRAALRAARPRVLSLPLFDPLRLPGRARHGAARSVPRVLYTGVVRPFAIPVRRPPMPDDPIPAQRLALRLAALGRALDDLPRQAKRFARWRCRVAAGAQREESRLDQDRRDGPSSLSPLRRGGRGGGKSRTTRIWPLRPGPPPGRRLAGDELRQILENTHGLALMAMAERRDTS